MSSRVALTACRFLCARGRVQGGTDCVGHAPYMAAHHCVAGDTALAPGSGSMGGGKAGCRSLWAVSGGRCGPKLPRLEPGLARGRVTSPAASSPNHTPARPGSPEACPFRDRDSSNAVRPDGSGRWEPQGREGLDLLVPRHPNPVASCCGCGVGDGECWRRPSLEPAALGAEVMTSVRPGQRPDRPSRTFVCVS